MFSLIQIECLNSPGNCQSLSPHLYFFTNYVFFKVNVPQSRFDPGVLIHPAIKRNHDHLDVDMFIIHVSDV